MGDREGQSWKSFRGRNTVWVSVLYLSDPARVRGRESIWPPSFPSLSLGAEHSFSPVPCQNHPTVYILDNRAPRNLLHLWTWAFYLYPTSHDNTSRFSSPFTFPTLTFFYLFLIGCAGQANRIFWDLAKRLRKSECSEDLGG